MSSYFRSAAFTLIFLAGLVSDTSHAEFDRRLSSRFKAAKCARLTRPPLSPQDVNAYLATIGGKSAIPSMKAAILGGWSPDLLRRQYGMIRSAVDLPEELLAETMKSVALTGWSTRELKDYFTAMGEVLTPAGRLEPKNAVEALKAAVLGGWSPDLLRRQYGMVRSALDLSDELLVEAMKSVAVSGWMTSEIKRYFAAIADVLPSGRPIHPKHAVEAMKAAALGGWSPELLGAEYKSIRLALNLPDEVTVEVMKAAAAGSWSPSDMKKYFTAVMDLTAGGKPIDPMIAAEAMKAAVLGSWTPQELRRQFLLVRSEFPDLSDAQAVEVMSVFANSTRSVLITGLMEFEALF